jgi:hypothetical protein
MYSSETTTFGIDRQSGQNISNVGGDQTIYYGDVSRATRIGKVLAVLGLLLTLVGLAALVPIVVTTAHSVLHDVRAGGAKTPLTQYLPWGWPVAVGLLVGGFVVKGFARVMVGR